MTPIPPQPLGQSYPSPPPLPPKATPLPPPLPPVMLGYRAVDTSGAAGRVLLNWAAGLAVGVGVAEILRWALYFGGSLVGLRPSFLSFGGAANRGPLLLLFLTAAMVGTVMVIVGGASSFRAASVSIAARIGAGILLAASWLRAGLDFFRFAFQVGPRPGEGVRQLFWANIFLQQGVYDSLDSILLIAISTLVVAQLCFPERSSAGAIAQRIQRTFGAIFLVIAALNILWLFVTLLMQRNQSTAGVRVAPIASPVTMLVAAKAAVWLCAGIMMLGGNRMGRVVALIGIGLAIVSSFIPTDLQLELRSLVRFVFIRLQYSLHYLVAMAAMGLALMGRMMKEGE